MEDLKKLQIDNSRLFYKKIFAEKISNHVCWIRYRTPECSFERPFKLDPSSSNKDPIYLATLNTFDLTDCVSNMPISLNFSDLLMFHLKEQATEEEINNDISKIRETLSQFKFVKGKKLQDLFFVVDDKTSPTKRMILLKIMDLIKVDTMYDYFAVKADNIEVVKSLKEAWFGMMTERYNQTITSIDDEIKATNDPSIVSELTSIKGILENIPAEAKLLLSPKNTCKDILDYWPTLLLPKPDGYSL